ncbi:MAG: anti-sigma factor antagonist [Limnothrix sp. CACIAM 69d]|nr:MAG: anti-sigma factor antagonist [Limnothrix sp. CACIAM 69d]
MDRLSIVQPFGILDGKQAGRFRQEVSDRVQSGTQHVLVDFQDVSFMDSSGLGALVLALKTARSAGAKLYLCSINDQVKMLFDLTSMDRVFEIYPDQESFMEHFNSL